MEIEDFVSRSIIERLHEPAGVLGPRIDERAGHTIAVKTIDTLGEEVLVTLPVA